MPSENITADPEAANPRNFKIVIIKLPSKAAITGQNPRGELAEAV